MTVRVFKSFRCPLNAYMAVSLNSGTPTYTPKYYNPIYWYLKKVSLFLGYIYISCANAQDDKQQFSDLPGPWHVWLSVYWVV